MERLIVHSAIGIPIATPPKANPLGGRNAENEPGEKRESQPILRPIDVPRDARIFAGIPRRGIDGKRRHLIVLRLPGAQFRAASEECKILLLIGSMAAQNRVIIVREHDSEHAPKALVAGLETRRA